MLIKNCMLIDGADIFEKMKDIRIVNGKIKEVADCLMPEGDEEIIDAEGALVTPGIVEPSCQVGVNSQIHRFEENDANEEGPIVPELRAYDALNFEDEGFSGGNLNRPDFKKMMTAAKDRKFKAIVVYRLDRISRNISDFSSLIEELERETIFDGVPARRQEKGQALLHKL